MPRAQPEEQGEPFPRIVLNIANSYPDALTKAPADLVVNGFELDCLSVKHGLYMMGGHVYWLQCEQKLLYPIPAVFRKYLALYVHNSRPELRLQFAQTETSNLYLNFTDFKKRPQHYMARWQLGFYTVTTVAQRAPSSRLIQRNRMAAFEEESRPWSERGQDRNNGDNEEDQNRHNETSFSEDEQSGNDEDLEGNEGQSEDESSFSEDSYAEWPESSAKEKDIAGTAQEPISTDELLESYDTETYTQAFRQLGKVVFDEDDPDEDVVEVDGYRVRVSKHFDQPQGPQNSPARNVYGRVRRESCDEMEQEAEAPTGNHSSFGNGSEAQINAKSPKSTLNDLPQATLQETMNAFYSHLEEDAAQPFGQRQETNGSPSAPQEPSNMDEHHNSEITGDPVQCKSTGADKQSQSPGEESGRYSQAPSGTEMNSHVNTPTKREHSLRSNRSNSLARNSSVNAQSNGVEPVSQSPARTSLRSSQRAPSRSGVSERSDRSRSRSNIREPNAQAPSPGAIISDHIFSGDGEEDGAENGGNAATAARFPRRNNQQFPNRRHRPLIANVNTNYDQALFVGIADLAKDRELAHPNLGKLPMKPRDLPETLDGNLRDFLKWLIDDYLVTKARANIHQKMLHVLHLRLLDLEGSKLPRGQLKTIEASMQYYRLRTIPMDKRIEAKVTHPFCDQVVDLAVYSMKDDHNYASDFVEYLLEKMLGNSCHLSLLTAAKSSRNGRKALHVDLKHGLIRYALSWWVHATEDDYTCHYKLTEVRLEKRLNIIFAEHMARQGIEPHVLGVDQALQQAEQSIRPQLFQERRKARVVPAFVMQELNENQCERARWMQSLRRLPMSNEQRQCVDQVTQLDPTLEGLVQRRQERQEDGRNHTANNGGPAGGQWDPNANNNELGGFGRQCGSRRESNANSNGSHAGTQRDSDDNNSGSHAGNHWDSNRNINGSLVEGRRNSNGEINGLGANGNEFGDADAGGQRNINADSNGPGGNGAVGYGNQTGNVPEGQWNHNVNMNGLNGNANGTGNVVNGGLWNYTANNNGLCGDGIEAGYGYFGSQRNPGAINSGLAGYGSQAGAGDFGGHWNPNAEINGLGANINALGVNGNLEWNDSNGGRRNPGADNNGLSGYGIRDGNPWGSNDVNNDLGGSPVYIPQSDLYPGVGPDLLDDVAAQILNGATLPSTI